MLEKDVERKVRDWVRKRGWKFWKLGGQHNRGKPDDLILGDHGFTFILECKRPGNKPTKLQVTELTELKALGHYCGWGNDVPKIIECIEYAYKEHCVALGMRQ